MSFFGDLERTFAEAIYPNRVWIGLIAAGMLVALAVIARRRHWDQLVRRHRVASAITLIVVLSIVMPLGWYLGSPLLLSTTIDEPAPVVVASSAEPTLLGSPGSPEPFLAASPRAAAEPPATPSPSQGPRVELSGMFSGADDFHFGEGTALLIETAPGTFAVRLEDFAVRNGPDLFVYLSPSQDGYADGAVEVGRLKADRGNQNYEVPADTDPAEASSVVIWCKQFAVLFQLHHCGIAPGRAARG